MKAIIFSFAVLLLVAISQSKLLGIPEEHQPSQHMVESGHPKVQNLMGSLLQDLIDFFKNPNSETFISGFSTITVFYLIPFSAGFLRPEMHNQYMKEEQTYKNAEITEDYLYNTSLRSVKKQIYRILGQTSKAEKL